jgi:hypothetical protein
MWPRSRTLIPDPDLGHDGLHDGLALWMRPISQGPLDILA